MCSSHLCPAAMFFVAIATFFNREGRFSKHSWRANHALEAIICFISQTFFFCCLRVNYNKRGDRKVENKGSADLTTPSLQKTAPLGLPRKLLSTSPISPLKLTLAPKSLPFRLFWRHFRNCHAFGAAWHRKTESYQNCAI